MYMQSIDDAETQNNKEDIFSANTQCLPLAKQTLNGTLHIPGVGRQGSTGLRL